MFALEGTHSNQERPLRDASSKCRASTAVPCRYCECSHGLLRTERNSCREQYELVNLGLSIFQGAKNPRRNFRAADPPLSGSTVQQHDAHACAMDAERDVRVDYHLTPLRYVEVNLRGGKTAKNLTKNSNEKSKARFQEAGSEPACPGYYVS